MIDLRSVLGIADLLRRHVSPWPVADFACDQPRGAAVIGEVLDRPGKLVVDVPGVYAPIRLDGVFNGPAADDGVRAADQPDVLVWIIHRRLGCGYCVGLIVFEAIIRTNRHQLPAFPGRSSLWSHSKPSTRSSSSSRSAV